MKTKSDGMGWGTANEMARANRKWDKWAKTPAGAAHCKKIADYNAKKEAALNPGLSPDSPYYQKLR